MLKSFLKWPEYRALDLPMVHKTKQKVLFFSKMSLLERPGSIWPHLIWLGDHSSLFFVVVSLNVKPFTIFWRIGVGGRHVNMFGALGSVGWIFKVLIPNWTHVCKNITKTHKLISVLVGRTQNPKNIYIYIYLTRVKWNSFFIIK